MCRVPPGPIVPLKKARLAECQKSSEDCVRSSQSSLVYDLWQTQLHLWTIVFGTILTYVWQHSLSPKAILMAIVGFSVAGVVASVLAAMVFISHVLAVDFASGCVQRSVVYCADFAVYSENKQFLR